MNTMEHETVRLAGAIRRAAEGLPSVSLMEVCGTHTAAIRRLALDTLLPENVRLISGPGCPVCVTAQRDIAAALALAARGDICFFCFGDMLRVPCGGESLERLRGAGHDIRVAVSALDALAAAEAEPGRQVVFFGVGFETTAPSTAKLLTEAKKHGLRNLSVLSAHKTMPAALRALLRKNASVDGILCPGHVAAVTGWRAFRFLPDELSLPAAVAGFDGPHILLAVLRLLLMLRAGRPDCVNMYPEVVTPDGNKTALALLSEAFIPCAAEWRGLGTIEGSGLAIAPAYRAFDASERFELPGADMPEPPGCQCAAVLRGAEAPAACPLFGVACTPEEPAGPCMVSREGACHAEYMYGRSAAR